MCCYLIVFVLLCFLFFVVLVQDCSVVEIVVIKDQVFNGVGLFVMGNFDGDVMLVEFSDYNCGFCCCVVLDVVVVVVSDFGVWLVIYEILIFGEGL